MRRTTSGTQADVAFASPGVISNGASPNFFALGDTLAGDPFDDVVVVLFDNDWSVRYAYRLSLDAASDHHEQPGRQGCRLMIRGDDSWRSDPRAQRLDSALEPDRAAALAWKCAPAGSRGADPGGRSVVTATEEAMAFSDEMLEKTFPIARLPRDKGFIIDVRI